MDCGSCKRIGAEGGQVAIAFVATVPLLILLALALVQLALAGHAALSAANAARAAARADYVGGDPERAARRALPPSFRPGAEV
ncbi:MAG: pilus assembly protein, partial [Solirubrobacterales bacterium]|nr:pilus assembly protein [Solirubrobacterales bacterium]